MTTRLRYIVRKSPDVLPVLDNGVIREFATFEEADAYAAKLGLDFRCVEQWRIVSFTQSREADINSDCADA